MADAFCRDCLSGVPTPTEDDTAQRCATCHSPRILAHSELNTLTIAHMDCDAFYAAVEQRDDPSLREKPLIIGGRRRGVVTTACYKSRLYGVRSAMPMFKALRACPEAVVVKPNMEKYARVSKEIRQLLFDVTPLVEPISIDEAFLDLTGTERLHGQPAARTLAILANRIEAEIGITVSIGLSHNKFLAKIASDLDKPRGFCIIGYAETHDFLAKLPVTKIWGVGKAFARKLKRDGIEMIADLQAIDDARLLKRYGEQGSRLARLSRGEDARSVKTSGERKSISAERTFETDISDADILRHRLWNVCEKVAGRAKDKECAGKTVTLKLKTKDFRLRTRSRTLDRPTQWAQTIYTAANELLARETDGTAFRLLGVGLSGLVDQDADAQPEFLDARAARDQAAEQAIDKVRSRFGEAVIQKGRSIAPTDRASSTSMLPNSRGPDRDG